MLLTYKHSAVLPVSMSERRLIIARSCISITRICRAVRMYSISREWGLPFLFMSFLAFIHFHWMNKEQKLVCTVLKWLEDQVYIFWVNYHFNTSVSAWYRHAEQRILKMSQYLHMPSLICFPWRDPLCFVTFRHSAQSRLMCWLVSLSVCLSDFMFIASKSVFMIWRSLTLPVYLVICHISPPPSPSVFLLSLLLSFAVVNLNTHLSLEVVKQKCLFEQLSIFLFFFHLLCMAGREWHCNYEICPLKPSPDLTQHCIL